MKFTISLLIVCISITSLLAREGYYWRFYTGEIPEDALEGGKDEINQPVYIGMTLHPGDLTVRPGIIYPHKRSMFYGYGGKEYKAVSDVHIFCTDYKEQFKWIKTGINTTIAEVTSNYKLRLIQAGSFAPNNVLYVGRTVVRGNQALIGTSLAVNGILNNAGVSENGVELLVTNYEILAYDAAVPDKESVCGGRNNITINIYN